MDSSGTTPWNDRIRQERLRRNWRQREVAEQLGTTTVTVTRWELGLHQPSAYFRLKLSTLFEKSAQELGFSQDVPSPAPGAPVSAGLLSNQHPKTGPLWSVPYPRNPFFTGREEILRTLHEQLHRKHTTALTQSWAISGLGGIGKTQIALEYAYWSRQNYLGELLGPVAADALTLDQAIETLRAFSLLQRHPETSTLHIHRLVQTVHKDETEEQIQRLWVTRVIQAVNALFPQDVETANWQQCRRLLSQAQNCASLIQEYQVLAPEAADLLSRTASYLTDHALYELAESLFQRALHIWEQIPGEQQLNIATTLYGLAQLNKVRGKYEQAEELLQQTLNIREQALGTQHLDVARTLHRLAELSRIRGNYEQAEQLFQQARSIVEQNLGPDHPETMTPLNGLVVLYRLQGKYQQAEVLAQRTLRIREQVLRPDHPDIARALNGLANLYIVQNKYELAEPLCLRALHIWEQALGPEHPQVAVSLNNLALLYQDQKKNEQAEALHLRALGIWEQALGPEHVQTANSLNNLAELYTTQGKYSQAEALHQRTLHIWEQALGQNHPNTGYALNGLANISCALGNYEQATSFYQQAIARREQALGTQHVETAESFYDFAVCLETQGKFQGATTLYQRAHAIREQVLGSTHARTIETRERLHAAQQTIRMQQGTSQYQVT